ncbi:MAG: phosphoribosylaminoimidazolesuccinocarboxamide synthase [Candidatus Woesearchaeota archaeon]
MIPADKIRKQLKNALDRTDFKSLGKKYEGKVRDNYTQGNKRVIITTDRISAFDRVLCTIPYKGQVLNQMAVFWFENTKDIVKNHMIHAPDPNVMVVEECNPLPIEMVVREYVTGVTTTSIWYNYKQGVRNFCGNRLPEGMKKDQKLPKPILTPSTKAQKGGHDESLSCDEIVKRKLVSREDMEQINEISLKLFERGKDVAAKQGVILVDTKYEFGKLGEEIILIDEIHTPDSSRFWFADTYQALFNACKEQRKIDKEYVRTWLADRGFIGEGAIPPIPDDVRVEAARLYIEAYEKVTGLAFKVYDKPILKRIKENLHKYGYLMEEK